MSIIEGDTPLYHGSNIGRIKQFKSAEEITIGTHDSWIVFDPSKIIMGEIRLRTSG